MLEQVLKELFIKSFKTLYNQEPPAQQVNFQKTRPEFEGDMTIVVFPFTEIAGRNPEQLANEMGAEMIKESDMIAKYNVVKGFLNLLISDKFWMDITKSNDIPSESALSSSALMRSATSSGVRAFSGVCALRFSEAIMAPTKQIIKEMRFILVCSHRVGCEVRRCKDKKDIWNLGYF